METALADLGSHVTADAIAQATTEALHAQGTQTAQAQITPPSVTPTSTLTPTSTPTALPVPTEAHGNGIYLVGPEIARGRWASDGGGTDDCYWVARKANGIILESYFGPADIELTLRFDQYDYQFDTEHCGLWEYQGP